MRQCRDADRMGLEELKDRPNVEQVYKQLKAYTDGMIARGEKVSEDKVSVFETKIYRSAHRALTFKGRVVLLVGDAESGVISGNGLNKGLKGAAFCAYAVSTYFSSGCSGHENFINYNEQLF